MNKAMIDLETFGTGTNACVVQIGACYFDEQGNIGKSLKMNVDGIDSQKNGGVIDASTIYWWLEQSEEARKGISNKIFNNSYAEKYAWECLNSFLSEAKEIWSHATFDFVIMTEAFKRLQLKPTFHYRAARDIRTLLSVTNYQKKLQRVGVHHDALDDCKFQVAYCTDAMRSFKGPLL